MSTATRRLAVSPLLALLLLGPGCVSYHGIEPPETEPLSGELSVSKREVSYVYQHNGRDRGDITGAQASRAKTFVNRGLDEAGVLLGHGEGLPRVELRVVNNEESSLGLAFFSGLTFCLVPCWGENLIAVEGRLISEGETVATACAEASIKTFMQLFLVFALPFEDRDFTYEVIERLSLRVATDLRLEAQRLELKGSAAAPESDPRGRQ